jgi:hypothetical protein
MPGGGPSRSRDRSPPRSDRDRTPRRTPADVEGPIASPPSRTRSISQPTSNESLPDLFLEPIEGPQLGPVEPLPDDSLATPPNSADEPSATKPSEATSPADRPNSPRRSDAQRNPGESDPRGTGTSGTESPERRTTRKIPANVPGAGVFTPNQAIVPTGPTSRPTVHVVLAERFANQFVQDETTEESTVDDTILGAKVAGEQWTTSRISLDFRPSATKAHLVFVLSGQVQTRTVGRTEQGAVETIGRQRFQAEKDVFFDGREFSTRHATVFVQAQNQNVGASTPLDGTWLQGVANRVALRVADRQKPAAEDIARQRVADRIYPQFDGEVDAKLASINHRIQSDLANLLGGIDVRSAGQLVTTTNEHLHWAAAVGQTEATTDIAPPALRVTEPRAIVAYLHETAINGALAALKLEGWKTTDQELKELEQRWRPANLNPVESAEPVEPAGPVPNDGPLLDQTRRLNGAGGFGPESNPSVATALADGDRANRDGKSPDSQRSVSTKKPTAGKSAASAATVSSTGSWFARMAQPGGGLPAGIVTDIEFDQIEPIRVRLRDDQLLLTVRAWIRPAGQSVLPKLQIDLPLQLVAVTADRWRLDVGEIALQPLGDPDGTTPPPLSDITTRLIRTAIESSIPQGEFPATLTVPNWPSKAAPLRLTVARADQGWLILALD